GQVARDNDSRDDEYKHSPHGAVSLSHRLHQRSRSFQVAGLQGVRSPVDQRAQSAGWVVAGILGIVAGSHHEHIRDLPALAIAIHHARRRIGSYYRTSGVMGTLIRRCREWTRSRRIDHSLGTHAPGDFTGLVGDEPTHAEIVVWKIKGDSQERQPRRVAVGRIQIEVVPSYGGGRTG